jgi:hypothetical protein
LSSAGFDDRQHFILAHDEELLIIKLDLLARILTEQNHVARLDIERYARAAVFYRAGAGGGYGASLRLLLRGVGDNDSAAVLLTLFVTAKRLTGRSSRPPRLAWPTCNREEPRASLSSSEQRSDPQQQSHTQRDRYSDRQDHERDAENDGHRSEQISHNNCGTLERAPDTERRRLAERCREGCPCQRRVAELSRGERHGLPPLRAISSEPTSARSGLSSVPCVPTRS